MILKGYLFSVGYAVLCLCLAFLLYKLGVEKKITRKVVHILVGFEWVILYNFMGATLHFLAVCILFLLILGLSHRKNLMPMISSEGDNAPGTVYYAVAMSIMAGVMMLLPDMMLPFGIGVFCTSFGDGFAGLFGQLTKRHNPKIYGNKTLYGSFYNFIICYIVAGVFNLHFALGMTAWNILAIALLSTELELFTGRGLDNISITLGTSFLAYFFIHCNGAMDYILPILLTPAIIAFAKKKNALTLDGIISAVILDIVISLTLGNFGFTVLFTFFALGIVADKIKKRYKKVKQNIEKRGECRNYVQVLSNALVASILALLYFITNDKIYLLGFVASLAEALADTLASGIGALSGRAFDLFRFKLCQPGLSGGMSLLGTAFSLVGAVAVSLVAFTFGRITAQEIAVVTVSAFLGALIDSLLGSLAQVKYRCVVCGSILEREEHCGKETEHFSGLRFINNDVVNLLGTLFAALIAMAITVVF